MKLFFIVGVLIVLVGCAYYPKQIERYDSECKIVYKELILKKSSSVSPVKNCDNEACIATLLSIPIQVIVAGSIVIAGNTVFWLEKEGECLLKTI